MGDTNKLLHDSERTKVWNTQCPMGVFRLECNYVQYLLNKVTVYSMPIMPCCRLAGLVTSTRLHNPCPASSPPCMHGCGPCRARPVTCDLTIRPHPQVRMLHASLHIRMPHLLAPPIYQVRLPRSQEKRESKTKGGIRRSRTEERTCKCKKR